jgi:hypothetical protein
MAWFILTLVLAVAPPLTEAQRQQLDTARDHDAEWDEPALYPLLRNVGEWTVDQAVDAPAPDYDALHRVPQGHRGDVFLIEGLLGGPPQVVKRALRQPGPWEANLQQWSVVVRRDPDEVAVVLLIDPMPPGEMPARGGALVRLAARFFKVLQFVDRNGQPTSYLMFVGRSAQMDDAPAATPVADMPTSRLWLVAMIFFVALAGWFMMRRLTRMSLKPSPLASRRRADRDVVTPAEDLPTDPADALDALQRRHGDGGDVE